MSKVSGSLKSILRKIQIFPIGYLRKQYHHFRFQRDERKKNTLQVTLPDAHTYQTIHKLAFLIHNTELINHYGSVWTQLPRGSFDIVLHNLNVEENLHHFAKWDCQIVDSKQLLENKIRYQHLVSNHPISAYQTPLIKQLGVLNCRFMYAAGKSGWNLADWNRLYDVFLCYGPFHASKFNAIENAITMEMGYPRFDRFFTEKQDRKELYRRYNCDPAKKTIAWLPTWKELSSVGLFDKEISALTNEYNVIVKLHPLMPSSEPHRVEALQQYQFTHLITDESDNLPLYQLADYMLFDYGGPPLAGIYTDKKMILLNVPDGHKHRLTGKHSPDIAIRKEIINVNAMDLAISKTLNNESIWQQQKKSRQTYRNLYFAPYFGFSSAVAAGILLNIDTLISNQLGTQTTTR